MTPDKELLQVQRLADSFLHRVSVGCDYRNHSHNCSYEMKLLLYHALSFLFCLTLGFCFALWITYVAVNVANELMK